MSEDYPCGLPVLTPTRARLLCASSGARLSPLVKSVDQNARMVRTLPIGSVQAFRRAGDTPALSAASPGSDVRPIHQRVLDVLFQPSQSFEDARVPKLKRHLSVEEIQQLVEEARDLMAREPTLLYVSAPCRVVSDLHGQFSDLMRMWGWFGAPDGSIPWVFLGDYVDRSAYGVEILLTLYAIKIKWPDKIFLLRGNHEIANINRYYGFKDELYRKWGTRRGEVLFNAFNDSFDYMPLAAIAVPPGYEGEPEWDALGTTFVPSRYLLVHGGIGRLETLEQISSVQRPVRTGTGDLAEQVLNELCWSDPATSDDHNGLLPNKRDNYAGGIVCYGADRVQEFCQQNRITAILRGHECIAEGLELAFGGRVMTFFSAVNYGGHGSNHGCILHLALTKDEGNRPSIEIQPIRLEAKLRYWSAYDSDCDSMDEDGDVTDLEPDQDLSVARKLPDQGPVQRRDDLHGGMDKNAAEDRSWRAPAGPTSMTCDTSTLDRGIDHPDGAHDAPFGLEDERSTHLADVDADTIGGHPDLAAARHLDDLSLDPGVLEAAANDNENVPQAAAAAAQGGDLNPQQRSLLQAVIQSPEFQHVLARGILNFRSAATAAAVLNTGGAEAATGALAGAQSGFREDDAGSPGGPAQTRPARVIVAFPWAELGNAGSKCPTPPRRSRDAGQFGDQAS